MVSGIVLELERKRRMNLKGSIVPKNRNLLHLTSNIQTHVCSTIIIVNIVVASAMPKHMLVSPRPRTFIHPTPRISRSGKKTQYFFRISLASKR